jgi:hypothetical protein
MGQISESGCSSWPFQLGLMFAPFTPCSLLALLTNSISGLKGFLLFRNIRKLWLLKVLTPGDNFLYHFLAWGVQPIAPDIKHNTICITTATKTSFGLKISRLIMKLTRKAKFPITSFILQHQVFIQYYAILGVFYCQWYLKYIFITDR